MRLEDYGKKIFASIPPMSEESIKEELAKYFVKNLDSKYHLLLGKEVSYYTVFNTITISAAENMYDYLNCSFYEVDGVVIPMSLITHIETRDDGCLEMWIGKVYFHLAPFDWGVEAI